MRTLAPLPDIFKLDNLLPEQDRAPLYNFLRHAGWKYGWKSNGKNDIYSFWHSALRRPSQEDEDRRV